MSTDIPTPIILRYSGSLLGTVPSTPITIGITFARIFHIFLNSLARSWYFYFLSSFVSSTLVSSGSAASINWQFFSCLFTTTISGILASMPLLLLLLLILLLLSLLLLLLLLSSSLSFLLFLLLSISFLLSLSS